MANVQRGLITRNDVAFYDGVTRTASRVDASGGTVTGLNFSDEVDVLQVFGAGTSRTAAAMNDAVTRLGGATATLLFSTGTWTVDSNLTIPSTVTCHVSAGCIFSVDAGKTLTFSGLVYTEYPSNWFSGSGTVTVTIEGSHFGIWHRRAAEVTASVTPTNFYIEKNIVRYNAIDDDSTDNATAFQNASKVGYIEIPETTSKWAVSFSATIDNACTIISYGRKSKIRQKSWGVPVFEIRSNDVSCPGHLYLETTETRSTFDAAALDASNNSAAVKTEAASSPTGAAVARLP